MRTTTTTMTGLSGRTMDLRSLRADPSRQTSSDSCQVRTLSIPRRVAPPADSLLSLFLSFATCRYDGTGWYRRQFRRRLGRRRACRRPNFATRHAGARHRPACRSLATETDVRLSWSLPRPTSPRSCARRTPTTMALVHLPDSCRRTRWPRSAAFSLDLCTTGCIHCLEWRETEWSARGHFGQSGEEREVVVTTVKSRRSKREKSAKEERVFVETLLEGAKDQGRPRPELPVRRSAIRSC